MKIYNKLIRDRIPEIIEADGKKCEVKVLDDAKYLVSLNQKLSEEIKEYSESGGVEELADIAEIVYAIAEHNGVSAKEFEKIRLHKREERGGFEKRLLLVRVYEDENEFYLDFESVWEDIKIIVENDNVIETLARKKPRTVLGVVDNGLLVLNREEPELVEKEWIKAAWDALMQKGKITNADVPFQGRFSSSFILALLSRLDYVDYELNPVELHLKGI